MCHAGNKAYKEDWPIVLQLEFQLYNTFKTKVLENLYAIAMSSFVMSLSSRDLLMLLLICITIH